MKTFNWKLSDIYATNDDFLKDLTFAKEELKALESFKGKLCKEDSDTILTYLKRDSKLSIVLEKLAVYARTKTDDDGKNEESIKNYQLVNDLFSVIGEKLSFVKTELSSLSDEFLNKLKDDKDFKNYNLMFEDIIKDKPHTLSLKEETTLAQVSSLIANDDIYSVLSDIEMNHGSFVDENGKEQKLTTGNYNKFMKNPSQEERKKVQEAYLEKYFELNQTMSNLYISHSKYVNFVAKTHNFKSALDMLTFEEDVSPDIMLKNMEYVSSKVNLLQRYFKLKQKYLKLDKFYTSDIGCDLINDKKSITFEDAVSDIKNSYGCFGDEYKNMFEKAVNDGWIDAFPRDTKASGGYTISNYSTHPFILLNFDGTAYWKSAITHEFGHAMHSYYSAKNQPYEKYDYTIFVAEVASLTNELILEDYMLKKATSKAEKIQLLSDFLQLFYLNVYNSSMLAEFELYVHSSLDAGESLTNKDLNDKYLEICKKYFGKDVEFNKFFEADWSRKSHIFSDYYLYKYSTGLICACYIAQRILTDKTGEYVKKYKSFLSLGGSLDPVNSLKVADIDILSTDTYDYAFKMFEDYLTELESLTLEDLW